MAKIELNNLSSGYNINTINVNFGKIETEFKDKVVYRNEASPMERDIDLNGFGAINLRDPVYNGDAVSYGFLLNSDALSFTGLEYRGLWTATTVYAKNNYVTVSGDVYIAQEAHTSTDTFATDLADGKWVVFSAGGGDMLSSNNLNDVASVSQSRTNLNVPSRSGEGATGSWNINAATATLATLATNANLSANSSLVGGFAESQLVKQTTSTGSAIFPTGTTAQRDGSPLTGYTRFNTTLGSLEFYSGSGWQTYSPPADASTTVKGLVELATNAETQTGTDTTRAITPAAMVTAKIQLGTAGGGGGGSTSFDFASIPSWVKRVTVMFSGISTTGTSSLLVQIGQSGSVETSGYLGSGSTVGDGISPVNSFYTTGFGIRQIAAGQVSHGVMTLQLLDGNTWAAQAIFSRSDVASVLVSSGSKTLAGVLGRVRITTIGGTDTFDAGTVNISYE